MKIQWITVPNNSESPTPAWLRTSGISEDGLVFLPAAIGENENITIMSATYDGDVPIVMNRNRAYLPADWLASEFPEIADDLMDIAKKVRGWAK